MIWQDLFLPASENLQLKLCFDVFMCLAPILIKNKSRMHRGKVDCLATLRDTKSQYIYVNCGVCPECLRKKQMYLVQRCQLESMDNHLFFGTLTYSNSMLRSYDVNGFNHSYADFTDFQKMLKRLRKHSFFISHSDFKYLVVNEYGSKRHRPHFHFILFIPKQSSDTVFTPIQYENVLRRLILSEWKRNVGSTRTPIYLPLCDYCEKFKNGKLSTNFDFHYVNPCLTSGQESDVSFYVTKYCLKYDKWIDDKRKALYLNCETEEDYYMIWSKLKPSVRKSHNFGITPNTHRYIRECIDVYSSRSLYPLFRNPLTGQLFPMSPYLFNKFGTLVDKYEFYYRSQHPDSYDDNFHYTTEDYEYINKYDRFFRQNSLISSFD